MMIDCVAQFYDDLAEDYHRIFDDWNDAIERQGQILNSVIRAQLASSNPDFPRLLDCSCGIGTQAIGLAQMGYAVTATDLSPNSIYRARREASSRGVKVAFSVSDFRALESNVAGEFDVVLSADNALPHLQTDEDLSLASQNMYAKLRGNGLLIITMRDYDALLKDKPRATVPNVFDRGSRIAFQVWDWVDDSDRYMVNQFVMQFVDNHWETKRFSSMYRAIRRAALNAVLDSSGFFDVTWRMPEETGFYQPLVTARKR